MGGPDLDGNDKAGAARVIPPVCRYVSVCAAVYSVLTGVLLYLRFSQTGRSDSSVFLSPKATHGPNGDIVRDGTTSDGRVPNFGIWRNEGIAVRVTIHIRQAALDRRIFSD
jgi:hypothetical protein